MKFFKTSPPQGWFRAVAGPFCHPDQRRSRRIGSFGQGLAKIRRFQAVVAKGGTRAWLSRKSLYDLITAPTQLIYNEKTRGLMLRPPLLVLMATLGAGALHAQDADPWRVDELALGVHASLSVPPYPPSLYSNSLIIVGQRSVLLVDTREVPRAGDDLVRAIEAITDLPIRYVVNSHWHWDHVNGNQSVRAVFPDVSFVMHPETSRLLLEEGPGRIAERAAGHRRRLDETRARLAADAEDERPEEERMTREDMRALVVRDSTRAEAYDSVVPIGADELVEDRWSPPGFEGRVELIATGLGHTPGDIAVWLPAERILFVGDLIEDGFPYTGDGSVLGTARALRQLSALGAVTVVPGHGSVESPDTLFEPQARLLTTVAELACASRDDALTDQDGAFEVFHRTVRTLTEDYRATTAADMDEAAYARGLETLVTQAWEEAPGACLA